MYFAIDARDCRAVSHNYSQRTPRGAVVGNPHAFPGSGAADREHIDDDRLKPQQLRRTQLLGTVHDPWLRLPSSKLRLSLQCRQHALGLAVVRRDTSRQGEPRMSSFRRSKLSKLNKKHDPRKELSTQVVRFTSDLDCTKNGLHQ